MRGVAAPVARASPAPEGTGAGAEGAPRRLGVTVTGAALAKEEARVTILGVPDLPGVVHRIFRSIAEANVVVGTIGPVIGVHTGPRVLGVAWIQSPE